MLIILNISETLCICRKYKFVTVRLEFFFLNFRIVIVCRIKKNCTGALTMHNTPNYICNFIMQFYYNRARTGPPVAYRAVAETENRDFSVDILKNTRDDGRIL